MPIATVDDFATRYGPPDDENKIAVLLADATSLCQQIAEQTIEHVEDDEVYLDVPDPWCSTIFLPELPVTDVSEVVDNGATLNPSDYWWYDYGKLQRPYTTWAAEGPRTVKVTYSHGYDPMPLWLIQMAVTFAHRGTQSWSIDGIRSESFTDAYAVTYQGGGGTDAVLWASGSEVEQLCSLKIPVVAM